MRVLKCFYENLVTIQCNVVKYHNLGTSLNRNKANSGRNRSSVTYENIERVRELLESNLHSVHGKIGHYLIE